MRAAQAITEPSRQTPVFGEFDVVVLGGGPSGIAAATAAARGGSRTLLVESYGFLGGMGTVAGVTNFCGLHANVFGKIDQVVHGVADDLLEHMRVLGGLNEPHLVFGDRIAAQAYDNAAFKVAADQLVLGSGAQLLFHALAVGVAMRDARTIDAVLIETKSGRQAVRARFFIDCSGDGDLAFHAGAAFEKGSDGHGMMYPSTMFRVNGVDPARATEGVRQIGALMEQAQAGGRKFARKGPIVKPQKNPSEWRVNVTQLSNPDGSPVDGTVALQLSAAEVQGRQQIVDFFDFLRSAVPGFEKAYLLEIAPQVGVRETRRVLGDYQLSETDVLQCVDFDDSIGVNGWMIEEHVAGNVALKWQDIPNCRGYNQLPWRMLLPRAMENLLVAGRCASMTHMGQSAARVSGACFVMGQAAGSAASMACEANLAPHALDVGQLQARLQADGAWLGGDGAP